tara:strand:+ start:440 stop:1438 length:999 start_codon:yes stop_codon:yes gene_type:complete
LIDCKFYKNYGPFKIQQLLDKVNCDYIGNTKTIIEDISPIELATKKHITFFNNKKYLDVFEKSNAGVFIVQKEFAYNKSRNYLISDFPYYTFAEISRIFYPESTYPDFYLSPEETIKLCNNKFSLSVNTFVHKTAKLGKNTVVGANSIVGPNVKIGDNCKIGDNVSIYYAKIYDNVVISSGTKIGSDGFGFAIKKNNFLKIPQVGRVIIKKNVEIGANCCIDRGSAGDTIINENCMLDNMIHIAHNVEIGRNCILAAQIGISGSTRIGNNVTLGGQVGIAGHLKIGDKVTIAAKSGVIGNVDDNMIIGGYPAKPIKKWHRETIYLKNQSKKR